MPLTITKSPGAIKRFRRTPWRFQQTVEIPEGDEIARFVTSLIGVHIGIEQATVTVAEIIFHTARMDAVLGSLAAEQLTRESAVTAKGRAAIEQLLIAAFWDGNEFIVVPTPKPFVMYADHDGWVTFYANTKSNLNHIIGPLVSDGFKLVKDWAREL